MWKYLLKIFLLLLTTAVIGKGQDASGKIMAEIIASSSTKIVKKSPFSALSTSERIQLLPDGSRVRTQTTMKMFRDGEGRFRRENVENTIGGTGFENGFQNLISITDPVESVRYLLFPKTKTAQRFRLQNKGTEKEAAPNSQGQKKSEIEKSLSPKTDIVIEANPLQATLNNIKDEALGTRSIEGVEAVGTRKTTILPAGSVGNEKPIEIIYERWYARELELIIYSRYYDPRYGEQIYRLTDLKRTEPDASLFIVPSDYKIATESPLRFYTTKP